LSRVLLAAALVASASCRNAEHGVPTLRVDRGPFTPRIVAEGTLRAVRSTPITISREMIRQPPILVWLIEDGTVVSEGDLVARVDGTVFENALQENLAASEVAEARIAKATAEHEKTLHGVGLDTSLAREELKVAERFQASDTDLYSRMEILESAIDTELARRREEHATTSRSVQENLGRTDLELLEIQRSQARLEADQARDGLLRLELRAPHGGIVVIERRGDAPFEVGDMLYSGVPVATIPDLREMEAEVFVLEADAGGLAAGQRATVVVEARPGITYRARVASVDPVAQRRDRGSPVQYFRAMLSLERTDPDVMKPGQTVSAEIELAASPEAIAIPRQALTEEAGRAVVYRRRGSRFEAVEVTVGTRALGRVEITHGLEEGDVIALRPPTATRRDRGPEREASRASPEVGAG
jgi:RND family efflux transporter MFP subunit